MEAHIIIAPIVGSVSVSAGSTQLGESRNALELKESGQPPVVYVPRADIDMSRLVRTKLATKSVLLGPASYYSIKGKFGVLANAVWSYETPPPEAEVIAGHLAFHEDRVTVTRG